MTKRVSAGQVARRAKARREFALSRPEILQPTARRADAVGPTSMAVKTRDDAEAQMIEQFLARKSGAEK